MYAVVHSQLTDKFISLEYKTLFLLMSLASDPWSLSMQLVFAQTTVFTTVFA